MPAVTRTTTHLSILDWSYSVEFGITGHYDPGRFTLAGSQDADLSCHLPISAFCCTMWSQSTNVTDTQTNRRTDGRHDARSIGPKRDILTWHVALKTIFLK